MIELNTNTYLCRWVQMPLPFAHALMRLKLARPTTRAGRAARAACGAAHRAAIAVRRMAPAPLAPLAKRIKGTLSNKLQAALFAVVTLGYEPRGAILTPMKGYSYA